MRRQIATQQSTWLIYWSYDIICVVAHSLGFEYWTWWVCCGFESAQSFRLFHVKRNILKSAKYWIENLLKHSVKMFCEDHFRWDHDVNFSICFTKIENYQWINLYQLSMDPYCLHLFEFNKHTFQEITFNRIKSAPIKYDTHILFWWKSTIIMICKKYRLIKYISITMERKY